MWKLFKHLGEHKVTVLLIILLLIGQAYCDLALPSYTSDIVDVGIQQGGIENAVPEFYIAGQVQACIMVCLSISATGQVVDAAQGLIVQNGMLPGNLKPDRADITGMKTA